MKIAICDDEQVCIDRLYTLIAAYCTGRRLICDCKTFTDLLDFGESELTSYDVVSRCKNGRGGQPRGAYSTKPDM